MRIKVKAFGCKLTQCEAGEIESGLISAGYDVVDLPPFDIVIICGCTVTSRADYKVRQYLRRAKREFGAKKLILTGCSAQNIDQIKIRELSIDKVFPSNDKEEIVKYLNSDYSYDLCQNNTNIDCNINAHNYDNRTRGFVKIQDGCNQFCSYCIVPYVRGREVSLSPSNIIDKVNLLSDHGIKEVVLTGVHIGRYRHSNKDILGLCKMIAEETDIFRIRLSSIEPNEISDEMIEYIATSSKIAPHLHVPLQSGSDNILHNMNRSYTRDQYYEKIYKIYSNVKNIGIGTDIIVGFPGETEEDFSETYNVLESLPISYLHIFRYSKRAGTKAFAMEPHVNESIKRERMERLSSLDLVLRNKFINTQIGIDQTVIIERIVNSICEGITGNYLSVNFVSNSIIKNNIVIVKPIDYKNGVTNCYIEHIIL